MAKSHTIQSRLAAAIRPTRSPGPIRAAIRPAAIEATRPANCSAVTGRHVRPACTANMAWLGSRAAQSNTASHAFSPMNHRLSREDAAGASLRIGGTVEQFADPR
jgi:hypothetical protein